jgi:hypothetical protein
MNVTATQGNQGHYFEFQYKPSKLVLAVRFREMLVSNLGRGNRYPKSLVIPFSSFKNAGIGLQIKLRPLYTHTHISKSLFTTIQSHTLGH